MSEFSQVCGYCLVHPEATKLMPPGAYHALGWVGSLRVISASWGRHRPLKTWDAPDRE